MPCRTDYMDDPPARPNMENYVERSIYKEVKAEADLTTRLLCSILSHKSANHELLFRDIAGLKQWKVKHDEEDAKREAKRLNAIRGKIRSAFPNLSEAQISEIIKTGVFKEEE